MKTKVSQNNTSQKHFIIYKKSCLLGHVITFCISLKEPVSKHQKRVNVEKETMCLVQHRSVFRSIVHRIRFCASLQQRRLILEAVLFLCDIIRFFGSVYVHRAKKYTIRDC